MTSALPPSRPSPPGRPATPRLPQRQVLADDAYEAVKALAGHDSRFHTMLALLAGNQQLRVALERTHCHLHIFRLYSAGGGGTQTLAEHRLVAAAVTRGSAMAAAQAMRDHLENARDRLRASFE